MTVASNDRRRGPYTGNAVTTVFAGPKVFAASHLQVYLVTIATGAAVLQTTGFTVTGVGLTESTVTFTTAPPATQQVLLLRTVPGTQTVNLRNQGPFLPEVIEDGLDLQAMMSQQLAEDISRSIKVPIAATLVDGTITPLTPLGPLVVNAAGTGVQVGSYTGTGDMLLRGDLANSAAAFGAALVGHLQGGTGATASTVRAKLNQTVHVADFGAVGSGSDSAKFQAAVTYLDSLGGGVLLVNPSVAYQWTTKVVSTSGVIIRSIGGVPSEVTTNTNGGGAAKPRITWTGVLTAGAMYEVKATAANTLVFGGGTEGISWDGNALIDYAVHMNNCVGGVCTGIVRSCRIAGFYDSSTNGNAGAFSQRNTYGIHYVYGATADTENSHGILLRAGPGTVPSTQHRVLYANGLIKNGYMVSCGAMTDNFSILEVRGSAAGGGTGGALQFQPAGGLPYGAGAHTIGYIAGKIDLGDATCTGNHWQHQNSEGGGHVGTGTWHGEIYDYVTEKIYRSRAYALRKSVPIPANSLIGGGAANAFCALWNARTFQDAVTTTISGVYPVDAEMAAGTLESVDVYYGTNTAAAGNYRFAANVSTFAVGAACNVVESVTPDFTQAAPAVNVLAKMTLTTNLALALGDSIFVSLSRIGADALDTATTEVFILGFALNYRSSGPTSAGSGTYASIPAW